MMELHAQELEVEIGLSGVCRLGFWRYVCMYDCDLGPGIMYNVLVCVEAEDGLEENESITKIEQ
jgi:hypothetical protein